VVKYTIFWHRKGELLLWYLDSGENPRGILIIYDINLLELGFYPVAVTGKLVLK
jgi:hypothetical protein